MSSSELIQFINCKILRNHTLTEEHLWVRNGKIINPEDVFFDEKIKADTVIDCNGCIIAPGFIDIQINGGFGVDFSNCDNIDSGLGRVAKSLLSSGVTSFCPTIVTSPNDVYKHVLPQIKKSQGGLHGATVLGIHLEGPFININKKGAHPPKFIKDLDEGFQSLVQTYRTLENVSIITLAPELKHANEVISKLTSLGITVSVGHSMASLKDGESAISSGATLITHLFNAMLPVSAYVECTVSCKIKSSHIPTVVYN
uniref:Amidohydrolase-related domain-containing protein n=1 Tax=Photinus pyralis TaxID=7054 RepID=A0A1Y1L6X7_PHOPY